MLTQRQLTGQHDGEATIPSYTQSAMRIVAAFVLAALTTYISFAAFGAYILLDLKHNPPPPPNLGGIGAGLCFFIFGPLCALVAGIVGAFLAHYRRFHLAWLAFGLLVALSLTIVAFLILHYARVLPFEL
jgi:hypothetical protein